jgi:hypothetical protein
MSDCNSEQRRRIAPALYLRLNGEKRIGVIIAAELCVAIEASVFCHVSHPKNPKTKGVFRGFD